MPARAAPSTVHVDTETGFSGGEVQVMGLVDGLRARGMGVTLVTPGHGALAARAAAAGFGVRPLAAHGDLDLLYVVRLARLLARERADLVHLHTARAAWLGGLAARLAGVPAVVTRRQDKRLAGSWKRELVYRRLARAAIGIAPRVTEQIRATGAEAGRIGTIWSSVDPARLVPRAPRDVLRAELQLRPDEFVVATAAQLVERKGLDVLLAALALLPPQRPVVALVAGDGPERARLDALARALPGPHRAVLLGHVANVADVVGAADAFALPSRAEGLGVAALEAMALGLPVVATRVGGLEQAVGACGLLVPPDDAAALAAAVASLARDAELAQRLGSAARARVAAHFLFDVQVARYALLYERVLAGDAAPAAALGEP